ncbi:hypothetical protein PO878_18880 [Iamia majanohamensis]|uniref:Uncharacterized protein n=1 Tax=Iamia majanohamensis TaxID=467976 RepID=A0AAE9Y565_9ACTN|nr:hypothetical protein [Iamia majanohamensis]WCO66567.1 hypothetical protein PO878_18880 [Iamia majanohamensis]
MVVATVAFAVLLGIARGLDGRGPAWLAVGGSVLIVALVVGAFLQDRAERRDQRRRGVGPPGGDRR